MSRPKVNEFGARLKELRLKAGLTQYAAAKKVKVHPVQLAQYEQGKHTPRPEKLARILKALGGGPPVIMTDEGRLEDVVARREASETIVQTPVRLGRVSLAWVEQQVASYVHARGTSFADGQACVVVLRRRDVIELGKTLIEACGTKVEERP